VEATPWLWVAQAITQALLDSVIRLAAAPIHPLDVHDQAEVERDTSQDPNTPQGETNG
jgi:hypothetical protein